LALAKSPFLRSYRRRPPQRSSIATPRILCLILVSGNSIQQLSAGGAVLRVFLVWKYEDSKIALTAGDRLVLFTDGILEVTGSDGQEFGEDNLAAVPQANRSRSTSELVASALRRVANFSQGRFRG
jgi:sigma-B regulation protein RsbU (phosphoserine phosphatase)